MPSFQNTRFFTPWRRRVFPAASLLLLLGLFFLHLPPARAQEYDAAEADSLARPYTLAGHVVDDRSGKPLDGVSVRILNEDSGEEIVTLTDLEGKIHVRLPANTPFSITAYHFRYFASDTIKVLTDKEQPSRIARQIQLQPVETGVIYRLEGVRFALNSTETLEGTEQPLLELAELLRRNPRLRIELSTHTDARGDDEYNLALSRRRALALAEWLAERGIAPERIIPKGYGETRLVNHCGNEVRCNTQEHQENRRVEYMILEF